MIGAVAGVGDLEDESWVGGRFGEFDLGDSGLGVLGLPLIDGAEAEAVLLGEMGHGEAARAPLGDEGLLLGDGEPVGHTRTSGTACREEVFTGGC